MQFFIKYLLLLTELEQFKNFNEIRSEIQEKFNENLLAKRNKIDGLAVELRNSSNEFKRHFQTIENVFCSCSNLSDAKQYCNNINSEINFAYNSYRYESFPLEVQATTISFFGTSIQSYEQTLNSISNFTNAANCLDKTKSLFIEIFNEVFDLTRDIIIQSVGRIQKNILVTQGEIDKFVDLEQAKVTRCTEKGLSICECSYEYMQNNHNSTIFKVKQFGLDIRNIVKEIKNETISNVELSVNGTEERLKVILNDISSCAKEVK